MRKTSKEYCRITVLMFLVISLVIGPVTASAYNGPVLAVNKAPAALRARVTGAWMDQSIDKVLMDLADQAGVDIIKGPKVADNVTAKVTDVPLAEALTNILTAHGFTYVATDNMIRVTALSEITLAKEEFISKVYHITYADANDVAGALSRFVSDKGSVAFNRGTRHIAVTDTEKKMKAVDKFIAEIDRQTQQVLVDVKIYEITTSEGFDLGAAFKAARVIEYEAQGVKNPTTTTTTTSPGYDIVSQRTISEATPDITTTTHTPGYNITDSESSTENHPTTTTTTDTPGYNITNSESWTENHPTTTTTTDTAGYNTASTENRTEYTPTTTTTTLNPGYTSTVTDARSEDPYSTLEITERTAANGSYTETVTSAYPGTNRTDTLTTEMPETETVTTTATPDPYTRTDVTTQAFDPVSTTETTDGGVYTSTGGSTQTFDPVSTTETTDGGVYTSTDTSTQAFDPVTMTETTGGGVSTTTDVTREIVPGVTTTETVVTEQGQTGYYTRKRGKPFYGASFDPQQGGTLSFSLLDDAVDFEFALNVLKKDVESKLLANPRILVLDNETANFEIVKEIPYRELLQVAREDPLSYTEFKDVGVLLDVTPHIARDGLVKLHIAPEFSILAGQDSYGMPIVDARRADTVALIRDGQTIAIGGLRKRETSKSISKVPLLGDIPLLGNLFKSSSESVEINELVVLITPRIIGSMHNPPAEVTEHGVNGIPKAFRKNIQPQVNPRRSNYEQPLHSPGNGGDRDPALAKRSPEITLQLAYGYVKTERFELAKNMLDSVIARQPNNSIAHQYIGYCKLKLGDINAAIRSYITAVKLNGADFEAHRGLGVAYMLKARADGDPGLAARAIEQWQISLDINPDQTNREALITMIKAYSE